MKVTLKMIADRAQVSQPLVSKVLNDQECRVSEEKRNLIKTISQELGYQPKQLLGASKAPTKTIGLIQPSMDFRFIVKLTDEIQFAAQKRGYELLLFNTHESSEQERKYFEMCLKYGVDGILLSATDNYKNTEYYKKMKQQGVPIVFVDRPILDFASSYVITDNSQGAFTLTEKLIQRGHKKILFLSHGDFMTKSTVISRFEGYQEAMLKYGLESAKEIVYSERPLEHQMICKSVPESNPYTAIVLSTTWDFAKLLELLELIMNENDPPVDIAAFDSFQIPYLAVFKGNIFKYINSNLLIMEQDPQKMAEMAVDMLIEMLVKKKDENKTVLLQPELLEIS